MTEIEKNKLINRNNRIIEIVLKKIKFKCPDSVDMIAIAGSFCNGDIYEKSDLDLVIISRDEKAKCLDKCFILDDVGMDIYTHDWSAFEQMAKYSDPYVTKLIDLDIVYVHDENVMKRYKKLQNELLDNMKNNDIINDAVKNHLDMGCMELNRLELIYNDIGLAYRSLAYIIREVEFVIYMINESYVKRGAKRIQEEIRKMKKLPIGFLDSYNNITKCKTIDEVKESASTLVKCLNTFLNEKEIQSVYLEKENNSQEKKMISADNLKGTYEEIYSNWKNKMIHAVTTTNRYLSFVTMSSCQAFYDEMYDEFDIPKIELLKYYNPEDLQVNVVMFDNAMNEWLKLYERVGLKVNHYLNLEEFEKEYIK